MKHLQEFTKWSKIDESLIAIAGILASALLAGGTIGSILWSHEKKQKKENQEIELEKQKRELEEQAKEDEKLQRIFNKINDHPDINQLEWLKRKLDSKHTNDRMKKHYAKEIKRILTKILNDHEEQYIEFIISKM